MSSLLFKKSCCVYFVTELIEWPPNTKSAFKSDCHHGWKTELLGANMSPTMLHFLDGAPFRNIS